MHVRVLYVPVRVHTHEDLYIRAPPFPPPSPFLSASLSLSLSRGNRPSSSYPREVSRRARVYVTRGAMLHRATWKFSSRTRTHTRRGGMCAFACTCVCMCVDGSLRLCGVLYDSIVALMAPLSECVGGGAHGKCARAPSEYTLSTYTIHRTRPANYISRDRADFTNTSTGYGARVKYVRPAHDTHVDRGVVVRANHPPPLFQTLSFYRSLLRSFNSRFCWPRRRCCRRRIEREPEKRVQPARSDRHCFIRRLQLGWKNFRVSDTAIVLGNYGEFCCSHRLVFG